MRGRDVQHAVAIHVSDRDEIRFRTGTVVHVRLERPIAHADENGYAVRSLVRGYRVRLPVPIHVAHRDETWLVTHSVVLPDLEGSVPVAEKDEGGIVVQGRGGQIELGVAVPIRDGERMRNDTDR